MISWRAEKYVSSSQNLQNIAVNALKVLVILYFIQVDFFKKCTVGNVENTISEPLDLKMT